MPPFPLIVMLVRRAASLWARLTEPVPEIQDQSLRDRARLMASIWLTLSLFLATGGIFLPNVNDSELNTALIVFIVVLLLFLTFLTRLGYTEAAVRIAVITSTISISGAALIQLDSGMVALNYLGIVCLVAILCLSVREVLLIVGLHLLCITGLGLLRLESFAVAVGEPIRLYIMLSLTALVLVRNRHVTDREQTERYEQLIENVRDAVYFITKDGRITSVNAAFEQLLGWDRRDIIGQWVLNMIAAPYQAQYQQATAATYDQQEPPLIRVQMIRQDGTPLWIEVVHTVLRSKKQVLGMMALARNIDERQKTEEALRISEERYRMVSEMISDYAYAYRVEPDESITYEWTTDSYTRLTGYLPGDFGSSFGLFHPDDTARAEQDVIRTIRGETTRGEYRIFTKSGELRWIHLTRHPQWDEQKTRVIRYLGAASDITEQKLAEQALEASQQQLALLVQQSPLAFIEYDSNWRVLSWNPAAEKIFGFKASEMIGSMLRDDLIPKDQASQVHDDLVALARGEVNFVRRVNENITKDGRVIQCEWNNIRLVDENGNFVRLVAIAQDITERQRSEMHKLKLTLERERLALVSRFVLAVSHDFRTALANIETNRYLLQRLIPGSMRDTAGERLNIIREAVRHIAEQIDNLQTLSSVVESKEEFCDLNAIIAELVKDYDITAQQKFITLTSEQDKTLPLVMADDVSIKHAIRQLLSNALAYTPMGGKIQINSYNAGNQAVIRVIDNGQGIAPEHLPHIFDLFYRADESRALNKGGVGLGLSISRMIVEAHSGEITVENTPGGGSTFMLKLPLAAR